MRKGEGPGARKDVGCFEAEELPRHALYVEMPCEEAHFCLLFLRYAFCLVMFFACLRECASARLCSAFLRMRSAF
jgi:hypothetical protein